MTVQHTDIFHCLKCGNLVYGERAGQTPECCGDDMVHAVSDSVWELDEQGLRSVPQQARDVLRAMQAEHRQLVKRLLAERDRWNGMDAPAAADYSESRARLGSLRDQLAAHFADEECDGYMHEALAIAPRLNPRAAQLCCEHRCFLETLDRLTNALRFEEPESWKESRSDFGRLVVDLRRHEGSENALVQAAFMDDVGSGE